MEDIKVVLTESEERLFGELFGQCGGQEDQSDRERVTTGRAFELFAGSGLSADDLLKIAELAEVEVEASGQLSRKQFYVSLRLISAAQLGLPLTTDFFGTISGLEWPLPKFVDVREVERKEFVRQLFAVDIANETPPPPVNIIHQVPDKAGSYAHSQVTTDDNYRSGDSSPDTPTSKLSSSMDSVTPTNIVHCGEERRRKIWSAFRIPTAPQDGEKIWQQFDEDQQLLGTEEGGSSSDRGGHSSGEDEYDIWAVTPEQKEYYTNQFKYMQPDVDGIVSGTVAKEFFEKSKLPVHELSRIWQLADVNKDGALSLEEFFAAMHLVVLRRKCNIQLPTLLPSSLVPKVVKSQLDDVGAKSTSHQSGASNAADQRSSMKSPVTGNVISPHGKEWTRFGDSPTSTISSPGIKPVNFDFQKSAVEQDPKIFHPVPLRMSPESSRNSPTAGADGIDGAIVGPASPPLLITTVSDDELEKSKPSVGVLPLQGPKKDPPPPPPPRPKKHHARSSSLDLNKLGAPPAVPPRLSPNTMTSKKLVGQKSEPDVISLLTDRDSFADFAQFSQEFTSSLEHSPGDFSVPKLGAFEIYKRPLDSNDGPIITCRSLSPDGTLRDDFDEIDDDKITVLTSKAYRGDCESDSRPLAIKLLGSSSNGCKSFDKHELRSAIRVQREENTMLCRLNSELSQELSEMMEERIALEIQVEHLKHFTT